MNFKYIHQFFLSSNIPAALLDAYCFLIPSKWVFHLGGGAIYKVIILPLHMQTGHSWLNTITLVLHWEQSARD